MKQIHFFVLLIIVAAAVGCSKTVELKDQPIVDTRTVTHLTDFTIDERSLGDLDFIPTPPKSNSPAAIHYKSSNIAIATIRDDKWISIKSDGNTYITAYQNATNQFTADSVKVLFNVGKRKPQFTGLPDVTKLKTDAPFKLKDPVSNSTGKFVYNSDNSAVATVSGNTITIKGTGTAKITYTQQPSDKYGSLSGSFLLTVTETNPIFGTVTDKDGNTYKTVKIGSQIWMMENLKVTHYRNGDRVDQVTDEAQWFARTIGAFCKYNNDDKFVKDYGMLYNWYAVNDSRKLAPAGWHIPTDAEWQALYKFIGSVREEAYKLRETGTAHWAVDIGTNSTNFTALGGGGRVDFDKKYVYGFKNTLYDGYWWSATASKTGTAWFYDIYVKGYLERNEGSNTIGLSVRCIKD